MFQSQEAKELQGLVKRDRLTMEAEASSMFAADPSRDGFSCGYRWVDWVGGTDNVLFPRGAISEIAGLQQAGKTTLAMETVAFNQHLYRTKVGRPLRVLWVDFEHSLTKQKTLADALGMAFDEDFTYVQPATLEGGGQFVVDRCRGKLLPADIVRRDAIKGKKEREAFSVVPDIVVIDTVATARPSVEYTNKIGGTKQPAIRGKLWAEIWRNLTPELGRDGGTAVLVVNHLMPNLVIDAEPGTFVPKESTPNSGTLKFYAMARFYLKTVRVRRELVENPMTYEQVNIPVAGVTKIVAEKVKIGQPFRETTYTNYFGTGITPVPTLVEAALALGEKTGKARIHVYGKEDRFDVLKTPGKPDSAFGVGTHGMDSFVRRLENEPEALRVLAENVNPLFVAQIADWLVHPKHRSKSSPAPVETSVETYDRQATASMLKEEALPADDAAVEALLSQAKAQALREKDAALTGSDPSPPDAEQVEAAVAPADQKRTARVAPVKKGKHGKKG